MTRTSTNNIGKLPENFSGYKVGVLDINEKFLQLVWNTFEEQGRKITAMLIDRIIDAARHYKKESLFTKDGEGLENMWEDYCSQMRSENAPSLTKLEEFISWICYNEIIDLKTDSRDQYNMLTLYLSQSDYNYSECLLDDNQMEAFLLSEVQSAAVNYSKIKVAEFVER